MTTPRVARLLVALLVLTLTSACGSNPPQDGPPKSGSNQIQGLPDDAVPRPEPKSRLGNGPNYEVFGKPYTVMPSAVGYKERGVASWYGEKFHGNRTSNWDIYDMHAMTAATFYRALVRIFEVRLQYLKQSAIDVEHSS